jgi:hypothetical protein
MLSDKPAKDVLDKSKFENLVECQYLLPKSSVMQILPSDIHMQALFCFLPCLTCLEAWPPMMTTLASSRPSTSFVEWGEGLFKHVKFRLNNTVSSWLNPLLTFDPGGLLRHPTPSKALCEHSIQISKIPLHSLSNEKTSQIHLEGELGSMGSTTASS